MKRKVNTCAMRGRNPDNPSERGKSEGRYQQRLEIGNDKTSNTITTVQKDYLLMEQQEEYYYRIRKLAPREVFRLMDVDDADIDKIQKTGISRTQQYKMAGNSIVVSCLYHIFDKMFIHKDDTHDQLTLF